MWTNHTLTMRFVTPLCGGVPRSDKIVETWIAARAATPAQHKAMQDNPPGPNGKEPATLEEVTAGRVATLDEVPDKDEEDKKIAEEMKKVWVGFSRDEKGLFLRGANLRAHLKDCATVLGKGMAKGKDDKKPNSYGLPPIKQFASKVKNALYIKEDRLHILPDLGQQPYDAATSWREATMSVMTAQGQRTCLKRIDMCEPAVIVATIQLLEGTEIELKHIKKLLEYGSVHGFNQDRSLQYGRYEWTLEKEW